MTRTTLELSDTSLHLVLTRMLREERHDSCVQMRTPRLVDLQGFAQSLHAEARGLAPKLILLPLPS